MSYIKLGLILGGVLVVVAGAFYGGAHFSKNTPIDVVRPLRGPAIEAVYATGTVEPVVMTPIAPKNAARLMALMADEGENVTKGQTLAQMDDSEMQKTLAEMVAAADLAQKEYDRQSKLLQKKAVSEGALDQALSALRTAQARVDQTRAALTNLTLVAPADGVIVRRDGEVGEMIPVNQPVFWISADRGLRITTEVDEEDIGKVQVNQPVLIHADAFPDDVFRGSVQSITPKGDPVARSYRVRISLDQKTPLMIGMTAEANIVLHKTENALLVPSSALQDGGVWLVQGGKATRTPVTIGARGAHEIEIQSGLDEHALIVRDAAKVIDPKEKIRPREVTWSLSP